MKNIFIGILLVIITVLIVLLYKQNNTTIPLTINQKIENNNSIMKVVIREIKTAEGPSIGGSINWPSEIILENGTNFTGPATIQIISASQVVYPGAQPSLRTTTINSSIQPGKNIISNKEWIGDVKGVLVNENEVKFIQETINY